MIEIAALSLGGTVCAVEELRCFLIDRARDVNKTCIKILSSCPDNPCVFGNILDTLTPPSLSRLNAVVDGCKERLLLEVNEALKKGSSSTCAPEDHLALMKSATKEMVQKVAGLLQRGELDLETEDNCFQHNRRCPVDRKSVLLLSMLSIWMAGNPCQSWSSLGNRLGAFGNCFKALVAWCVNVMKARPHVVIQECTVGFALWILETLLGSAYDMFTKVVCPTMVGLPTHRPREYCVFALRGKVKVHFSIIDKEFEQLCFRKCVAEGDVYFMAPKSERVDHLNQLAHNRHLPSHPAWSLSQVLAPGKRMRLEQSMLLAKQPKLAGRRSLITNINANAERGQVSTVVPTLLRSSELVLIRSPKLEEVADDAKDGCRGCQDGVIDKHIYMLGKEMFEAMGWPMYPRTSVLP